MDDRQLIALYQARDPSAVRATGEKYGGLCFTVADGILHSRADSEECVNDVLLAAWNAIPPAQPESVCAFLCRIARNLALKIYELTHAGKRRAQVQLSLDELAQVLPDSSDIARRAETKELGAAIDAFLRTLPGEERELFVQRYWLFLPVKKLAAVRAWSQSKVKSMLARTRAKLRGYLCDFYGGDV